MTKSTKQELATKKKYNARPDVMKRRVAQNKARRQAIADGKAKVGDGKHVDHIKPLAAGGSTNKSKHRIQPWHIWLEYSLNPWDADIVKRILRDKGERRLDYEKIKHICDERIRQIDEEKNNVSLATEESTNPKSA